MEDRKNGLDESFSPSKTLLWVEDRVLAHEDLLIGLLVAGTIRLGQAALEASRHRRDTKASSPCSLF